jgi:DNA-binding winged helix-turn-helix (wHTH) protein/Flp pilus assembly protein TadD
MKKSEGDAETLSGRRRLADLVIEPDAGRVTRDGAPIALPELSFAVLRALMEAAPEPADADRLAARAWGLAHVSEDTITQRVTLLRKALGDDPKTPRYVKTVRGQGYALAAPLARVWPMRTMAASGLAAMALAVMLGVSLWPARTTSTPPPAAAAAPESAAEALLHRARALLDVQQAEETDRAIGLLEEARERAPDAADIQIALSFALTTRVTKFTAQDGDAVRAAALAKAVSETAPERADAWHALAFALDSQGRIDEAVAGYTRAFTLDAGDYAAMSSAAYLHSVRGRLHEALSLEARVLRAGAETRYGAVQIAQSLELVGHPAAEDWYERAALTASDQVVIATSLALRAYRRGEFEEGLTHLNDLATADRAAPRVQVAIGRLLAAQGEIITALAAFAAAGEFGAQEGRAYAGHSALEAEELEFYSALGLSDPPPPIEDTWPEAHIRQAEILAVGGFESAAFHALNDAVDLGWRDFAALEVAPVLVTMRGMGEWAALRDRIARELDAQRGLIEADPDLAILFAIEN